MAIFKWKTNIYKPTKTTSNSIVIYLKFERKMGMRRVLN